MEGSSIRETDRRAVARYRPYDRGHVLRWEPPRAVWRRGGRVEGSTHTLCHHLRCSADGSSIVRASARKSSGLRLSSLPLSFNAIRSVSQRERAETGSRYRRQDPLTRDAGPPPSALRCHHPAPVGCAVAGRVIDRGCGSHFDESANWSFTISSAFVIGPTTDGSERSTRLGNGFDTDSGRFAQMMLRDLRNN